MAGTNQIQEIIREYFDILYFNKFQNLEEMDKFLDGYDILKSNKEDLSTLNTSKTSNDIELGMKNLSQRQTQDQIYSLLSTIRTLKKH
jgi:hypothetical protein